MRHLSEQRERFRESLNDQRTDLFAEIADGVPCEVTVSQKETTVRNRSDGDVASIDFSGTDIDARVETIDVGLSSNRPAGDPRFVIDGRNGDRAARLTSSSRTSINDRSAADGDAFGQNFNVGRVIGGRRRAESAAVDRQSVGGNRDIDGGTDDIRIDGERSSGQFVFDVIGRSDRVDPPHVGLADRAVRGLDFVGAATARRMNCDLFCRVGCRSRCRQAIDVDEELRIAQWSLESVQTAASAQDGGTRES